MRVYGVMGDSRVTNSLSPRLHNAAFARRGMAAVYGAFPVEPDQVAAAVAGLRALGLAGANVTVPHKQAVAGLLDGLEPEAVRLGAVNTIVARDGELHGHNTDLAGFTAALSHAGFDPAGAYCLVLGAGGAARAVVRALDAGNAERVRVAGRDMEKVRSLCGDLGGQPWPLERDLTGPFAWDLVVNTTPVSEPGTSPDLERAADQAAQGGTSLVVDINYGRRENLWRMAAERGAADFQDGLAMLALQAAHSFALWTGEEPPASEFLAELGVA